jgi:putative membrane protein
MLRRPRLRIRSYAKNATAQSDDDKKFLAMAAQSDQNEIALSELAEQKATNPDVKALRKR